MECVEEADNGLFLYKRIFTVLLSLFARMSTLKHETSRMASTYLAQLDFWSSITTYYHDQQTS